MCLALTLPTESWSRGWGCAEAPETGTWNFAQLLFRIPEGPQQADRTVVSQAPRTSAHQDAGTLPDFFQKSTGCEPRGKVPSSPLHPQPLLRAVVCAPSPLGVWLSLSSRGFYALEKSGWWLKGRQSVEARQIGEVLETPEFRA